MNLIALVEPSPAIHLFYPNVLWKKISPSHADARKFSPLPRTLGYLDLTINSPPALDADDPGVIGIAPLDPELDNPEFIAASPHVPEANISPLMETNPSATKFEDPATKE